SPTGHTPDNVTLPLGVMVELDAGNKRLTILENPVRLGK
ncbi:MAG: LD-carboxypeptidase, partial [Planctomycetes bacterium]|nr:LD-carboxypeptidase [Planctomycetota bacterium]